MELDDLIYQIENLKYGQQIIEIINMCIKSNKHSISIQIPFEDFMLIYNNDIDFLNIFNQILNLCIHELTIININSNKYINIYINWDKIMFINDMDKLSKTFNNVNI